MIRQSHSPVQLKPGSAPGRSSTVRREEGLPGARVHLEAALRRLQDGPFRAVSPTAMLGLQQALGNRAVRQLLARHAERDAPGHPLQRPEHATALPTSLRAGLESMSGFGLSEVRVHFNSPRPAALNALAYTQGPEIHVGPGQEKHLPHEAWHVVQQKQGRVQPTLQLRGAAVSDDLHLEREADAMGEAAARAAGSHALPQSPAAPSLVRTAPGAPAAIQRKVGFEFETNMPIRANGKQIVAKNVTLHESASKHWKITSDASFIEFVTEPFEEEGSKPELDRMIVAVDEMARTFDRLHLLAKGNEDTKNTPLGDAVQGGTPPTYDGHAVIVPKDMRVFPATAKPQVTGGVSLENIPRLFEAAYSTALPLKSPANLGDLFEDPIARKRSETTPLGGFDFVKEAGILVRSELLASLYVNRVKKPGVQGWDKLQGLLALVFSYLLAGAKQEKVQSQAKYFLSLMSRMSFAGMYTSLPREVREAFNPEQILDDVKLNPAEPVYQKGFSDSGGGDKKISRGPSRKAWLNSILRGKDLMSVEGKSPVTKGMSASSPAMGQHSMLDPDVTGNPEQLVQIELRRLPGAVPPEEWVPLAVALFQMFQKVQAGKKR